MPVTITIYPDKELAVVKASGEVSAEEMIQGDVELYNHPDWVNGFKVLADYTGLEKIHLDQPGVKRLISNNKAHNHLFDKSRFAVAAKKDLVFGMARMWDTMADDLNLKRAVFRTVDEAMEWLEGD